MSEQASPLAQAERERNIAQARVAIMEEALAFAGHTLRGLENRQMLALRRGRPRRLWRSVVGDELSAKITIALANIVTALSVSPTIAPYREPDESVQSRS